MVYQEDVIKIAQYFEGLSLADGGILRRVMSGKERSRKKLQQLKDNFFTSFKNIGHSDEVTAEAFWQIESFTRYSFCKAHSASYSVESYQSLYLKVYYPLEFMVSAINNQGGFYRPEVYIYEARMSGENILTPCVNNDEAETTIDGQNIYLGLAMNQSSETRTIERIIQERKTKGKYKSLKDFI